MTPPRQVWLFQLGCWLAFATAVVHLAGHLFVAPVEPAVGQASRPAYLLLVPGQDVPSPRDVADGLSLALSVLVGTLGAAGLVVHRYGSERPPLLRGVARAYAFGTAVLLVLSIANFFSVQSFFIAMTALCFALASVTEA